MAKRYRITSAPSDNSEDIARKPRRKKISFNLEVRAANKRGTFPIYLRVTEDRIHRRFKSSIELSRKIDWNPTTQEIRTSESNYKKWNNELQQLLERAKDIYRDLDEDGIASPEKIIEVLEGGEKSFSFYVFAQQCTVDIYTSGAPETYLKYNGFCNKFRDYAKSRNRTPEDFKFKEITPEFVSKFEAYLHTLPNQQFSKKPEEELKRKRKKGTEVEPNETKLHQNSIAKTLQIFRAIMGKAVKMGYVKEDDNPFRVYKIKMVPTHREELTKEEVLAIINLNLKEGTMEWHSRNFFLFAMFCAGIRIADLLVLRWMNVTSDGHLRYEMGKNHKEQNIILVEPALEILNIYRDRFIEQNGHEPEPEDYIFPYMAGTKDYKRWRKLTSQRAIDELAPEYRLTYKKVISGKVALVNKGLRLIKCRLGLTKPLTSHISRHTFAGLAKDIHTDNSILQGLLQHSSLRTTERYMRRFDTESKDEALKEIFKPITESRGQKSIAEQLAEIPEKDLAKLLEEYRKKKRKK